MDDLGHQIKKVGSVEQVGTYQKFERNTVDFASSMERDGPNNSSFSGNFMNDGAGARTGTGSDTDTGA